jgi:hypothetical protein
LLPSEVEPVLAQRADFAAPGSGRDSGPQVQAEFLVVGPDEIEQPGRELGGGGSGSRLRGCGGLAFLATLRSAQS